MKKINRVVWKASGLVLLAFSVFFQSEAQQLRSLSGANSPNDDTNPVWIGNNTLLFTRAFHPSNLGGVTDSGDIWMTRKNEAGEWEEATHRPDLSSKGYDLALGLEDILTLVILRTEGGKSTLHQYSKFGQEWNYLRAVNFPGLESFEGTVSGRIASGGKVIFLAGKRQGGFGNEDIYFSEKTGLVNWSEPQNIGPAVNGFGQEIGPYFDRETNQLYFSSNSHPGASGKDILIAKRLGESWDSWSKPEKWEQISSRGSEASITFISKEEVVWTSTQNSDGFADLMTFSTPVPLIIPTEFVPPVAPEVKSEKPSSLPKPAPPTEPQKTLTVPLSDSTNVYLKIPNVQAVEVKPVAPVKAEVQTKLDTAKVEEIKVESKKGEEIKPKETQLIDSIPSQTLPAPKVVIQPNDPTIPLSLSVLDSKSMVELTYTLTFFKGSEAIDFQRSLVSSDLAELGITAINVSSSGYFPKMLALESLNPEEKTVVLLIKAEAGSTLLLENVNFKRGTAELEGENTEAFLSDLASFLIGNPQIKIRINGHTDNVGDPGLNKKLSLDRAGSVRDFLVSKGVNFENLRISGWGGTRPIASNSTEEGRAKNRRVELAVEN